MATLPPPPPFPSQYQTTDTPLSPLGSHPLSPPSPPFSYIPAPPSLTGSDFARPSYPDWRRTKEGYVGRSGTLISNPEKPRTFRPRRNPGFQSRFADSNSDGGTIVDPVSYESRWPDSSDDEDDWYDPDSRRTQRQALRLSESALRPPPPPETIASTTPLSVPPPPLSGFNFGLNPQTPLASTKKPPSGFQEFYGDEKPNAITVEKRNPSPTPTNSKSGRKLGFFKDLMSMSSYRKPKAPETVVTSQAAPSTNGSKWSRWGGGKIADSFKRVTTKAPNSKPEKPVTVNNEGQSAQSSKWRSRLPSLSFSRNKRGERRFEEKETEKEKETGNGGSSHWWNFKARSTQKGEGEKPAKTQTSSKFSFAKPWASVFNRTVNKPAKTEKTGSGGEATDAPKAAWWSPSRYTKASKRDTANGEEVDKPKSESFFSRYLGRKNKNKSESESGTGRNDSPLPSVKSSEEPRTDAGSKGGWFGLRSRGAKKNIAGEKPDREVITIVDPEDPEKTERPGGGRAAGKKSAESTNVDEDEPAKRSFFSVGGSSRRAKGAKTKEANEETQVQTLGKAWYSGVTSTLSKAGKAILRGGKRADRTISNGASAESTITAPTDSDNVPPPTKQTTNNINDGDTTDRSAKKSANRSFWTWGSSKRDKTKKSRGTGENADSAGGAQSNGRWKRWTRQRNRSSQEDTERLLKKHDKTISNGANSKSTAEGDSKSWSVGSLWPSRWSIGGRNSRSSQPEGVTEDHGDETTPSYLDYLETYRTHYHNKDISRKDRKRIETETRQALKSSRLSGLTLSEIAKDSKKPWTEADRSVIHDQYETSKKDTEVALALAAWDVASDSKGWSQIFSRKRDPTLRAIDLTRKRESEYSSKAKKSSSRATETEGGTEGVGA